MKSFLIFIFFIIPAILFSQQNNLKGYVLDEKAAPLGYASVLLLHPVDSTLVSFGITNSEGHFEIKDAKPGKYRMQVSYLGYQTFNQIINLPLEKGEDLGSIILRPNTKDLKEVIVSDEYIPLQIRKDTIEYNAMAFKTKPDAVVEDLLKKLPGVEVDRSGNIKALGEDVKNVFVDGKEFFSSDQKIATRNIPADAINKVQVYDKKSNESEFTNIDDGQREKTINLMLKDGKKKAVFGDVLAGGSINERYQASAKIYRFTRKDQFAALGMANNINQFGFSFRDYIDFSGGIQNFAHGSGSAQIRITGDNSFPVNFGQQVMGLVSSQLGGINYSHEFKKDTRFYLSYLANSKNQKQEDDVTKQSFTNNNSYFEDEHVNDSKKDRANGLNFGWKNRIDSTQNLFVNGSANLSYGNGQRNSLKSILANGSQINWISAQNDNKSKQFSGYISGSYLKKIKNGKSVFKVYSEGSYATSRSDLLWDNESDLLTTGTHNIINQFQDNSTKLTDLLMSSTYTQKIRRLFYIEPKISAGSTYESLNRSQGIPSLNNELIDSLSKSFIRQYEWLKPEITLKRNTEKTQFSIGLQMETGKSSNSFKNEGSINKHSLYFLPQLFWEYEYKTGRRLSFNYMSRVSAPTANQLFPVVNTVNPTALYSGNRNLSPENNHDISFHWFIFDQFSFTSLITSLSADYTKNKINWSRNINNNLWQSVSLINVANDYSIRGNIDFSTPIRKLGIKINTNLREGYSRGINYVNDIQNYTTNLNHKLSFSVDNRTKNKWDANLGVAASLADVSYSIQKSLNNKYLNISYYSEIRYNPNDHWNFQVNTDITNYASQSFNQSVSIRLVGGEVSYYFLKNKRGVLTLQGFDLLNKNTGLERTSEMNYLQERQSNIIGRYVMLSFKYRINKFGGSSSGLDIKINRH